MRPQFPAGPATRSALYLLGLLAALKALSLVLMGQAVAGMLAGLIVTLVYIFLHKGWLFIPDTNSFTDADPLLGTIKSTSFGAIGAMVNFAVAFAVSKSSKAIPAEIEELVESVRIPRGAGAAQDH